MEYESEAIAGETEIREDLDATSLSFVGRWNRLVSTTNWEKGRIISEWRARLIDADAPVQSYSDEAWSRRAGNVSVKWLPCPSELETVTSPPCSRRIFWVTGNPTPVPISPLVVRCFVPLDRW